MGHQDQRNTEDWMALSQSHSSENLQQKEYK